MMILVAQSYIVEMKNSIQTNIYGSSLLKHLQAIY